MEEIGESEKEKADSAFPDLKEKNMVLQTEMRYTNAHLRLDETLRFGARKREHRSELW